MLNVIFVLVFRRISNWCTRSDRNERLVTERERKSIGSNNSRYCRCTHTYSACGAVAVAQAVCKLNSLNTWKVADFGNQLKIHRFNRFYRQLNTGHNARVQWMSSEWNAFVYSFMQNHFFSMGWVKHTSEYGHSGSGCRESYKTESWKRKCSSAIADTAWCVCFHWQI